MSAGIRSPIERDTMSPGTRSRASRCWSFPSLMLHLKWEKAKTRRSHPIFGCFNKLEQRIENHTFSFSYGQTLVPLWFYYTLNSHILKDLEKCVASGRPWASSEKWGYYDCVSCLETRRSHMASRSFCRCRSLMEPIASSTSVLREDRTLARESRLQQSARKSLIRARGRVGGAF